MSKQTLLKFFPFVWILTVGLCYFILIAFTLFFFAASSHNLLAPATNGNDVPPVWKLPHIEKIKFFPMELVFGEFFLLSFIVSSSLETNLSRCSVHIGSWWEQKPVPYPHSSSPPPQNKPLTSGVRAAQMGLFWYISQIEITSRLHKFVFGEDGHAFLHSNEGPHQSALPQCPPKLHFFIHD